MPTPGNSLLLDTSVVVKHFRYPTAVVDKLAEYEELYLPQPALGELYYGAYRSGRLERNLAQIERFLEADISRKLAWLRFTRSRDCHLHFFRTPAGQSLF